MHRPQHQPGQRETSERVLKIQFLTVCWFSFRIEATSATVMKSSDSGISGNKVGDDRLAPVGQRDPEERVLEARSGDLLRLDPADAGFGVPRYLAWTKSEKRTSCGLNQP